MSLLPRSATLPSNAQLSALLDGVDDALLLLLDNCEHVAAQAALLAEAILGAAPRVQLLATSREPLRAGPMSIQRNLGRPSAPSTRGVGSRTRRESRGARSARRLARPGTP